MSSHDTVTAIKDRLSIVDVVQTYIPLERAGKQFRARCPFHNERTPSLYVNPDRAMFYCFGCQKGGDIFAFVQEIEKMDFKEALQLLADRAGVTIEKGNNNKAEYNRMRELLKAASDVFSYCMSKSARANEYVASRGISRESIARFAVGYAPKKATLLVSYLLKKGYTHDEMIRAGVAIKTQRGDVIDRFRGRIMFPLSDAQGRIVSFTGRILPEFNKEGIAKYMNGPDTELYHKSEILFGFSLAKDAIREKKNALLMEGQMDVVLAHQHGYTNAIALSGTALSDIHAKHIARYAQNVTVCLDGDSAGVRAAERNVWPLFGAELDVLIVTFAQGEDPASLLASGAKESFDASLASGMPYIEFVLKHIKGLPLREQYQKIEQHVYPWCKSIPNVIMQDKTLIAVSDAIGVSPDTMRKSFGDWLFNQVQNESRQVYQQQKPMQPIAEPAKDLFMQSRVHAYATLEAAKAHVGDEYTHATVRLEDIEKAYRELLPQLKTPFDPQVVERLTMQVAPMMDAAADHERVDFLAQTIKVFEQHCAKAAYQVARHELMSLKNDDPDIRSKLAAVEELRRKIDTLSVNP